MVWSRKEPRVERDRVVASFGEDRPKRLSDPDHVQEPSHLVLPNQHARAVENRANGGQTHFSDIAAARDQDSMDASDDLERVSFHPVEGGVAENRVDGSVSNSSGRIEQIVRVHLDPRDAALEVRCESGRRRFRRREEVRRGIDANDPSLRQDGGQQRFEREGSVPAPEVEDRFLFVSRGALGQLVAGVRTMKMEVYSRQVEVSGVRRRER